MMLPQYQHGFEMAQGFAAQELAKKNKKKQQQQQLGKDIAASSGSITKKKSKDKAPTKKLNQEVTHSSASSTDGSTEGRCESVMVREKTLANLPSSPVPHHRKKKTRSCTSVTSVGSASSSHCSISATPQSHRSKGCVHISTPFTASSVLLMNSLAIDTMRQSMEQHKCDSLQDLIQDELVAPLQTLHEKLVDQRHDLQETIQVQTDRARARYHCDNKTGTLISLRRIQRTQGELETIQQAQEYVSTQIQVLERTKVSALSSSTALQQLLDNNNVKDCLARVEKMLQSVNNHSMTTTLPAGVAEDLKEDHNLTDEQLLQEFSGRMVLRSHSSSSLPLSVAPSSAAVN
ncbi:hypothetical protein ACA910_015401 [Epithemia clementina (nom. ined.)]